MLAAGDFSYPVLVDRPDLSAYRRGNIGIEYVHQFDSAKAGLHVMISALVHGNELCGAIALCNLLENQIRPLRGKLTLAFMNVAAFDRFDPNDPFASRFIDEDFNRLWTKEVLESDRDSRELRRAREVRPVLETVDLLLDIHSMLTGTIPMLMAGAHDGDKAATTPFSKT